MLSQKEIQQFKIQFESKKQELIAYLQGDSFIDNSGDETDRAQAAQAKSISDGLARQKAQTISSIDYCLQKIKEGTFGECEDCGEDISIKRLGVQPYAAFCISCAEEHEMHKKQYV